MTSAYGLRTLRLIWALCCITLADCASAAELKSNVNKELDRELHTPLMRLNATYAKIRELEEAYSFAASPFGSRPLDFEFNTAKPTVMLVGPHSSGKTTLIKRLLGREYPGSVIKPVPSTDTFMLVTEGPELNPMPLCDARSGSLNVDPSSVPSFLYNGAQNARDVVPCSQVSVSRLAPGTARALDRLVLIDTPGLTDTDERSYNLIKALSSAAAQADVVVFLSDINGCHIGARTAELLENISRFHPIYVLTKVESDHNNILEQYGCFKWSARRHLIGTEAPPILLISQQDLPSTHPFAERVKDDTAKLLKALNNAPLTALYKRVSKVRERLWEVMQHAYIVDYVANEEYPTALKKVVTLGLAAALSNAVSWPALTNRTTHRARALMREAHLLQAEEANRRITPETVRSLLESFHDHLPNFPERFQRGIFWNAPNLRSGEELVTLAKKISGELDSLVRSLDAINSEKLMNQRKYEEATGGHADTYLAGKAQAAMDWCMLQDAEGTPSSRYRKTETALSVPMTAVRTQLLMNLGNTVSSGKTAEVQVNSILEAVMQTGSYRTRLTPGQYMAAWSEARRLALNLPRLSNPLAQYAEAEKTNSDRNTAPSGPKVNWGTRSACEATFQHQASAELLRGKLAPASRGSAHAEL